MKDPNAVLNTYLTDMAAVEKHILEAVERQLNGDALKRHAQAHAVVQRLHDTLNRHVHALEAEIENRKGGGLKEAVKEAVGTALGFAAGLYDKVRSDEASRMIRDNYVATSMAAIAYHMLHTTALGLRSQHVADLAIAHLKDLTPILVELSKVVCHVVAEELADEGKIFDGTVGPQAEANTHEAWSASYVGSAS